MRHNGFKRFQCGQCPAKFVSKGNLKAHMSVHSAKKPYACNECGSTFTQSYSLVKHNRIHTGERPFQVSFASSYCVVFLINLFHILVRNVPDEILFIGSSEAAHTNAYGYVVI